MAYTPGCYFLGRSRRDCPTLACYFLAKTLYHPMEQIDADDSKVMVLPLILQFFCFMYCTKYCSLLYLRKLTVYGIIRIFEHLC